MLKVRGSPQAEPQDGDEVRIASPVEAFDFIKRRCSKLRGQHAHMLRHLLTPRAANRGGPTDGALGKRAKVMWTCRPRALGVVLGPKAEDGGTPSTSLHNSATRGPFACFFPQACSSVVERRLGCNIQCGNIKGEDEQEGNGGVFAWFEGEFFGEWQPTMSGPFQ